MGFISRYKDFVKAVQANPLVLKRNYDVVGLSAKTLKAHQEAFARLVPEDKRDDIARQLSEKLDQGQSIRSTDLDDRGVPIRLKEFKTAESNLERDIDKLFSDFLGYFNRLCRFTYQCHRNGKDNKVNQGFKNLAKKIYQFIDQVFEHGDSIASLISIQNTFRKLQARLENYESGDLGKDEEDNRAVIRPNFRESMSADTVIVEKEETETGTNQSNQVEAYQGMHREYLDFVDFDSFEAYLPDGNLNPRLSNNEKQRKILLFDKRVFLKLGDLAEGGIKSIIDFYGFNHCDHDSGECINERELLKTHVTKLIKGESLDPNLSNQDLWLKLRASMDDLAKNLPETRVGNPVTRKFFYTPEEYSIQKNYEENFTKFLALEFFYCSDMSLEEILAYINKPREGY